MMIVRTTFPNFRFPDHDLSAPCPLYGWPNVIIRSRDRELYYPEHTGPLTIMCNFSGRATYETNAGLHVVDDGSFVILNGGQRFAASIRSESSVESFHLNFQAGLVDHVLHSLITPADRLLEAETPLASGQPVQFMERVYAHDVLLSPFLFSLRSAIDTDTAGDLPAEWLEERFCCILERLVLVHRNVRAEVEQLPAVRRTTQVELYRRLHRAKNFIDANSGDRLGLADMAAEAYLSPYHFLRLFRQAFSETPYQYLLRKRLECAQHLLLYTDRSITDVSDIAGFESLRYFSWLFRRRFSISPHQFRLQHAGRKIAIS